MLVLFNIFMQQLPSWISSWKLFEMSSTCFSLFNFFSFFFHINVSHFIAVAIIYGLDISIGEYVPALAFVIAVPAMGLILDMVIIIEDYIGSGSKADAAGNFEL